MIKVEIIEKRNYGYLVKGNNNKEYDIKIRFYHLKKELQEGNFLYLPEKILLEDMMHYFGPLGSKYSINKNPTEEEFIKIVTDQEEFYVQRYYG